MSDPITWKSQLLEFETLIDQSEKRLMGPRKQERDKRTIKAKIPSFQHNLSQFDNQLTIYSKTPAQYGLQQAEITALISRINTLRNKLSTLEQLCAKDNESARSALLGDPRYRNIQDSEETVDMTNQQLYKDHLLQQENEEAKLEDISQGLGQLNDIGRQQNQKLTHHATLTDELSHNMDIADHNLNTNIQRVDIVEESSRGGWISLLVMVLLLVAIILACTTKIFCWSAFGCNQ